MPIAPLIDLLRRAPAITEDLRAGRFNVQDIVPASIALIAVVLSIKPLVRFAFKLVKLATLGAVVVGAIAVWRNRETSAAKVD